LDASVVASRISGIFTTQIPAVPRLSLDIKPANSDDAPTESPHASSPTVTQTASDSLGFYGPSMNDITVVLLGFLAFGGLNILGDLVSGAGNLTIVTAGIFGVLLYLKGLFWSFE
jgi:hypothetical protein